jgi:hypothetical protein
VKGAILFPSASIVYTTIEMVSDRILFSDSGTGKVFPLFSLVYFGCNSLGHGAKDFGQLRQGEKATVSASFSVAWAAGGSTLRFGIWWTASYG